MYNWNRSASLWILSGVLHPQYVGAALTDCVFALGCAPVDGPVLFDTFQDCVRYTCQDKDSAVLSHMFFPGSMSLPTGMIALCRLVLSYNFGDWPTPSASTGWLIMTAQLVSTLFIGVLLAFIRVSHWANGQCRACTYLSLCSPW